MRRILFVFLLITSILVSGIHTYSNQSYQAESVLVDQNSTGIFYATNCVPSSVKIVLNLLGVESEIVHDIRMKIWYNNDGCLLYDAMKYIESYDIETDWNYIDDEEYIKEMLDEWYAMCIVSENGYRHCVVVADYVDEKYVILDPLRDYIVTRDRIGIIDEFVIYIRKSKRVDDTGK